MILTVTPNPCVDKTVFADRLEPGAKIRSQRCTCIPGGKGTNVARAVKALGFESAAMVVVGGHTGRHVVEMIEQQDDVRCIPLWVHGMTRTITTVLEEPLHRQTAIFEPGSVVTEEELPTMLAALRAAIAEADVITLNGTVCHPILRGLYRNAVEFARAAGKRTVLDAYGPEFELALDARPDLIKPNLSEAEQMLGRRIESDADRWVAIDTFHARGVPCVVLSLGAEGVIASNGAQRWRALPPAITEVNAVGSGDSLVAALAIGMQVGWPLEDALRLGVAAGTANAMSWDIAHFTRAEVDTIMPQVRVQRA